MAPLIYSPQDRQHWWRTLVSLPTYYHLLSAGLELRAADTPTLSPVLRQARQRNLDRLRAYRMRGQYPRNIHSPTHAVPCFMDHEGRLCAVAHLMHASGETAAVREIARTPKELPRRGRWGPVLSPTLSLVG